MNADRPRLDLALAVLSLLTANADSLAADNDLPIERLGWLIGNWETRDEQLDGDYVETGPRDCDWGLDQRYIICSGVGTNHLGKSREYVWYFNYNHMEDRFEMNSLYGDWPRKNLFIIELDDDNLGFSAMSYFFTEDGLEAGNPQRSRIRWKKSSTSGRF